MEQNLNLARKWRSKKFNEIVGQDISVRMLQNSLYKNHYFPVYLFSGQRGCGKTSTARVFAAAINCEQLELFRKDPKNYSIPCLACQSCRAMQAGKHPDFIEMDAASHTGVDMIRQVIDASSFLPLMGTKKIYLIDEAHMLSKAAFNALLKILEEPPSSVLFILATTDPHKIIDTVKSRCFQLFFRSIDTPILSNYLREICSRENIKYEQEALTYIINETEGSVRDALNLLEQVRFSASIVTKGSVLQVLGHLDDAQLIDLFASVLQDHTSVALQKIKNIKLDTYDSDFIWKKLIDLSRALLWVKHGVEPQIFLEYIGQLKQLSTQCSFKRLNEILDILYTNESIFLKTTAKYALLEMILLQISKNNNGTEGSSAPQQVGAPIISVDDEECDEEDEEYDEEEDDEDEIEEDLRAVSHFAKKETLMDKQDLSYKILTNEDGSKWKLFVKQVTSLQDPLLNSVFSQGTFVKFDSVTQQLDIEFSKDLSFFSDWMNQSRAQWYPFLQNFFSNEVIFNPLFVGSKKVKNKQEVGLAENKENLNSNLMQSMPVARPKSTILPQPQKTYGSINGNQRKSYGHARIVNNESTIDVSDVAIWGKTNLVLQYFPGTVYEIKE